MQPVSALGGTIAKRFSDPCIECVFEFGNLTMTNLTEVRSLWVKTSYQPVDMLIQAPLPGMIREGKVDLRTCDLRNLLVQGEFRAVIIYQCLKRAKGIGFNIPESSKHSLRTLIEQFANDDFFSMPYLRWSTGMTSGLCQK